MIDKNKIFVVDNVAPDWLWHSWNKRILDAHRWKYGLAGTRLDEQRFFALWVSQAGNHRGTRGPFQGDHEGICNYFNDLWQDVHLPKILPDAQVDYIHRCHFNGHVPNKEKLGIHYDFEDVNMWTMVYYLEGTGGDTIFFDNPQPDKNGDLQSGKEIFRSHWKLNRAVFFPSFYFHYAEHPPKGFRITLSFNYLLNDCNINLEIKKDRGIKHEDKGQPDLTDFLQEIDRQNKVGNYIHKSHDRRI